MSGKSKTTAQTVSSELSTGTQDTNSSNLPCQKPVKPTLLVKVYYLEENSSKTPIHATVNITSCGDKKTAKNTGIADYSSVAPDNYIIKVKSIHDDNYFISDTATETVTLANGDAKTVELQVEKKNIVTPKIEVEYKVVLLDRNLAQYQDGTETTKFYADVTYIELSLSQTRTDIPYTKGAKFTCNPAKVEVYLDEKCTKKLTTDNLTHEQLPIDQKLKLYLKGKATGTFIAKLELIDPGDSHIKIEAPVEEKMGVVEIKTILHRFDKGELEALKVDPANDPIATYHTNLKNKALPQQKAMTDEQKVKEGRLLHVQDGNHHGRAKFVVKKLIADQWPDGTDDYEIILNNDNNGITLFDAETGGTEKPLAQKLKVKDLKKKEIEFWVEGKAESDKVRDIILDVGLDRASGGLAKTPKRYGDWSRYTVVKIERVEFVVTVPGGKPKVWDSAKKRYYINTEAGAAGRTLGDKTGEREVKVVVTLSKQIADVPLHFMLAPDPANATPAGMPATWKPEKLKVEMRRMDCKDRKALMHFSEKTLANGTAEMKKLVLSAFAGDKFTPAVYIEQDPHLAKYVQNHTDLGTRIPKLCTDTLQVWKHFDYKILYMKRHDGTSYSNRFTDDILKTKFEADFIEMERVGGVVEVAHEDFVPYDTARAWVTNKLGAEEPRQIQLAFVDGVGKAPEVEKELSTVGIPSLSFSWSLKADEPIDMSTQDKWLKTAQAGTVGNLQAIPNGRITLENDGVDYKLNVDLTNLAFLNGVGIGAIAVKITVLRHEGPSGLSWGAATLVSMRYRESGYLGNEDVATQRTAFHEVGHYLGLAPKTLPNTTASASGLWYNSPGVGNHCKYGPEDCTLWHQFIMKIEFCPTCKLALRARDHAVQVSADTPF